MSNEQSITIAGTLTADPELRFTPSGAAVANFTVAFNPRRFDKTANEWRDGTAQFWRCQAWNAGKLTMAENIADQLHKGDRVILTGTLEAREYEKDGQKRTVTEVRVAHIGKDALYHGQPHNREQAAEDPWGAGNDSMRAPF
jgi:single-strand DNA-binding protein